MPFKLRGPNERQILDVICHWLLYQPNVLASQITTAGSWDHERKRYRKAEKWVRLGFPDIAVIYSIFNIPIFIGLEVKAEDGQQRPSQKIFQEDLTKKVNGFYFVVRSVGDVQNSFKIVEADVLRRMSTRLL